MNKPVKINPDGLRRSANGFDDVAERTKKLLDTLKAASDSKGEAWGDDKPGHKFADGEKGYKKNRNNTFDSLANVVKVFEDNAKNLRDSAKVFEDNERRNAAVTKENERRKALNEENERRNAAIVKENERRRIEANKENERRKALNEENKRRQVVNEERQLRDRSASTRSDQPTADGPRNAVARPESDSAPKTMRNIEAPKARRSDRSIPGTDPVNSGGEKRAGSVERAPMAPRHLKSSIPGTDPVNSGGEKRAGSVERAPMAPRHLKSSKPGTDPVNPGGEKRAGSVERAPMAPRHTQGKTLGAHNATPHSTEHAPMELHRTESSIPAESKVNSKGDKTPRHAGHEPHSAPTEPQRDTHFPRMASPAQDLPDSSKPGRSGKEEPDA